MTNPATDNALETSRTSRGAGRCGWGSALGAAVVILGVYLFSAGRTTLWDRDEPRYARAVVEMLDSGNWLYPTFNGALRPDKPILIYWLIAGPVRLLGPTETAIRLPSVVGMVVSCLLTYFIGRRLFGAAAGFWAMLVLAASPLAGVCGVQTNPDAVLLAFLTGTTACFVASMTTGVRVRHLVLLALCTAGALLTKGPPGVLPLGVIALALLLGRGHLGLGGRYLLGCVLAMLAGAAVFFAWALPANAATGGEFFRLFVGRHVLERSLEPIESHGGNWLLWLPFYVPVVLLGFFPWVLHLPAAISMTLGARLGLPAAEGGPARADGAACRAILLAGVLVGFLAMTCVATKLAHYLLPIWPGLALMVGATISAWDEGRFTRRDRRWLVRGTWLFGALGLALGAAAILAPWLLGAEALRIPGAILGVLLLEMTLLGLRMHLRQGPIVSAKVLLGSMVVLELAASVAGASGIEQYKIVPDFARHLAAVVPPGEPVASYGFDEASLNFYLGRHVRSFIREKASPPQVLAWLNEGGGGVLVVTEPMRKKLESAGGPLEARIIASAEGVDLAKVRKIRLLALRRGPAPGTSVP